MRTIIILGLALALLPGVLGLAIAPAQHQVYYGDETFESRIRVINNHQEDVDVTVSVGGELAPYVNLETEQFSLSAEDTGWNLGFTLDMPPILEPGTHEARIRLHVAQDTTGMVGVVTVLESVVYLHVPIPGTHAEAEMISVPQQSGDVVFSFPISNVGSTDIREAAVSVEVLEGEDVVGELHSLPVAIRSNDQKVVHLTWIPVDDGEFIAVAKVEYDDKEISLTERFCYHSRGERF
jgi:hypothetical protein